MTTHPKQPMQPVRLDDKGTPRFKENAIVRWLKDNGGIDMNHLAYKGDDFGNDDQMQYAELIGYSVGGFSELHYVSDEVYEAASKAADEAMTAGKNTLAAKHPMQPIYLDEEGKAYFQKNAIVEYVLDNGKIGGKPIDMNMIRRLDFTDEDRAQFVQLLGYDVNGCADLSYVPEDVYWPAHHEAARLKAEAAKARS